MSSHKQRAPKKSKIPLDYDPTPDPFPIPEGKERPKQKSHIPDDLVSEYIPDHPLLAADCANMSSLDRKLRFLATKVVLIGGDYWVKDKKKGRWRKRASREVKNCLIQDWGNDKTRYNICLGTLDSLFADNLIMVLDATVCVPGGADFVSFQGKKCLNVGSHPQLPYSANAAGSIGFTTLMELIDRNLLNSGNRSIEDIIDDIEDSNPSLTKWVFHWLASLYQRPGRQLSTCLWFIGSMQGVGKTQFTNIMHSLLGHGNTKSVNIGELKSDWNDFLEGAQLTIADEVKLDSRRDFNDMLKRWIGNPVISLRRRNHGEFGVPNITNWIFTTNNTRPIIIEPSDRRHTFIATTEDEEARKIATRYFKLSKEAKQDAIEGFGALLNSISIDDQLISQAFHTDLKDIIVGLSERPLLTWLKSDELSNLWPLGTFARGDTIVKKYQEWARNSEVHHSERSGTYVRQQLRELENAGWIHETRHADRFNQSHKTSYPRGYKRLKDAEGKVVSDNVTMTVAPMDNKSRKLQRLQQLCS